MLCSQKVRRSKVWGKKSREVWLYSHVWRTVRIDRLHFEVFCLGLELVLVLCLGPELDPCLELDLELGLESVLVVDPDLELGLPDLSLYAAY
jgi:hypothetical protein